MANGEIDRRVEQWGERLFFPAPKKGKRSNDKPLKLELPAKPKASTIRRLAGLFARRAPQVVVKITGGSSSAAAIKAHINYATKRGERSFETEEGATLSGKESVADVTDLWRTSGSEIPWHSDKRKEALHIMVSMPRGTATVDQVATAARRFARAQLTGRHWVMVSHDHQANPHVHLLVKIEGHDGRRLNPRKADLQRWRDGFARELRVLGVDAQSTRQAVTGQRGNQMHLWQKLATADKRLRGARPPAKEGPAIETRRAAAESWRGLAAVLAESPAPRDKELSSAILARLDEGTRGRPTPVRPTSDRGPGVEPGSSR